MPVGVSSNSEGGVSCQLQLLICICAKSLHFFQEKQVAIMVAYMEEEDSLRKDQEKKMVEEGR